MLENNIIKVKLDKNKHINMLNNTNNKDFESLNTFINQIEKNNISKNNRNILILGDIRGVNYDKLIDTLMQSNIDLVCTVGDELYDLYNILPEKIRSLHTIDIISMKERIKFLLLDGDNLIISGLTNTKISDMVYHFSNSQVNGANLNKFKDSLSVFGAKAILFDDTIDTFLKQNNIPGASISIALNDKITYSNGYGFANKDKNILVNAKKNQFRLFNISQSLTAVAILILVDQKKINLEDTIFGSKGILSEFTPLDNEKFNNDLKKIKLIHLLQHTAGWDNRNTKNPFNDKSSFDPMFNLHNINKKTHEDSYATKNNVIRYMLSQPIQNKSGEKFVHSNFGYVILGRIIETISKESYIDFINKNISQPLNLHNIQLAKTKLDDCNKNETYYFPRKDNHLVPSVFDLKTKVVESYGAFALEEIDSSLGLVATIDDILNFALNFETLLSKETCVLINKKPKLKIDNSHSWYNGLGWRITNLKDDNYNLWSTGAIDIGGCTCFIARSANKNKISWAMMCNKSISTKSIKDVISQAKKYFE